MKIKKLFLFKGTLPWQGLKANTKRQKYEKISEKKMCTSIETLCKSMYNLFKKKIYFNLIIILFFYL